MISAEVGVADVAAAAPNGVICLLCAIAHYELTTTTPWEVYLAIPRKGWPPKIEYTPVRVIFFNDRMFEYGIRQEPLANHRSVRMYSPEKSIADAFHFEEHVGHDIALEGLKTYMARRRGRNIPELLRAAEICKVRLVMQRYVEALT